jgi:hypothetical protein
MSPKVLWDVVRAAACAGIDKLAPHDLRRTMRQSDSVSAQRLSSFLLTLERRAGTLLPSPVERECIVY